MPTGARTTALAMVRPLPSPWSTAFVAVAAARVRMPVPRALLLATVTMPVFSVTPPVKVLLPLRVMPSLLVLPVIVRPPETVALLMVSFWITPEIVSPVSAPVLLKLLLVETVRVLLPATFTVPARLMSPPPPRPLPLMVVVALTRLKVLCSVIEAASYSNGVVPALWKVPAVRLTAPVPSGPFWTAPPLNVSLAVDLQDAAAEVGAAGVGVVRVLQDERAAVEAQRAGAADDAAEVNRVGGAGADGDLVVARERDRAGPGSCRWWCCRSSPRCC